MALGAKAVGIWEPEKKTSHNKVFCKQDLLNIYGHIVLRELWFWKQTSGNIRPCENRVLSI